MLKSTPPAAELETLPENVAEAAVKLMLLWSTLLLLRVTLPLKLPVTSISERLDTAAFAISKVPVVVMLPTTKVMLLPPLFKTVVPPPMSTVPAVSLSVPDELLVKLTLPAHVRVATTMFVEPKLTVVEVVVKMTASSFIPGTAPADRPP